jgi:hypothetical protein
MSTEDLIKKMNEYKAQIKAVKQELNVAYKKHEGLENKLMKIKVDYVLQSDVLKEAVWEIRREIANSFSLYGTDKHFKKLSDMLQSDYHCNLELKSGVKLYFDDWDITLAFSSSEIAIEFVKKYKLNLKMEPLLKEKENLTNNLKALEEFLKNLV